MSARKLILAFALIAPLLAILLWPVSGWLSAGILFLSHMLLLYPTLRATCQWLGPVVTAFESDGKQAWLTIDDGPTEDTNEILEVLSRAGARATFFLVGEKARQRPDLVRRMTEQGHSIGNHSDTHPSASFWCLPKNRIREQIDRCSETLQGISGTAPALFRTPVGMKNHFVHPLLDERHMPLVAWSARGFDGVATDPEKVTARILAAVVPGTIILMHQGRSGAGGLSASVEAIERVVVELKARGYSFVIPAPDQFRAGRR